MNYSFYSNKVLLAEDLTSHSLNKHLWQKTPFCSKIVAPTTGQCRVLLYDAFTSEVKATVDVLHSCLLDHIRQIFANITTSAGVTISTFTALAIDLRKDYFINGVDAGSFLNYSVVLAGLSGFFYSWGCEDVPEHAVELISVIIPDYEMFHPFCIRLNEACSSFLQREQNILATVLQGSNCSSFPNPFDNGCKCDCFEYKETGESFKIVFMIRKLAMEKHANFCLPYSSYNSATYNPFDQKEFKESFMHSCGPKNGNILKNVAFPSKNEKYNTLPFKTLSNDDIHFGFPNRSLLYRMRNAKYRCPASKDVPSMPDLVQKQDFTDATEENVHANDSSSSKEQEEGLDVFCNAFKTKVETSLKQNTAESTDSYSEYSSSDSGVSESDASPNKLVIGQTTGTQNEPIIGCLNDKQVSRKSLQKSTVFQMVTESNNPCDETFLPKIVLEGTKYIQRLFNRECVNEQFKFTVKMSSRKTNNLKQPLPPPHISKESEDCENKSNKLPDILNSLPTTEVSASRATVTSDSKADSPKLLNHPSGENCEGADNSTSNTMSYSLIPKIKALFQYYQSLGSSNTSLKSYP